MTEAPETGTTASDGAASGAVAGLVERGDPDRWRTAMAAPPDARPGLLTLYAFNLELARASWVASEPLLAEIRLQWWADAVAEIYDGRAPRRHEVVEPLAATIARADLPRRLFDEMIAARRLDAESPLADVTGYVDHTAGNLMELAARHLGAEGGALPVVRDFGRAAGIAALLRALPELAARGRAPLPPGLDPAALARDGLAALDRARAHRDRVPRTALPALLPGWLAARTLRRAAAGETWLEPAPIVARGGLLWRAATGRWWT
ncbi:MAG: squalene/phytoene synthase family protein [Amaricoccus sp.]|uniref:squalene/phytoene synthase family protein n=1 Tax=Amaricoccus sp. TaxID=1872485 RepID=UPI0039E56F4E